MGGFRLNCSKEDKEQYKDKLIFHYDLGHGTCEGVLTYGAFTYLVVNGKLECPSISEEEIKDKSKGDVLFKALAVLQLFWFIVQIIVRVSVHLQVTNIELTTSGLAAAAILMYWCWWDKPLGVKCPVVLHLSEPRGPSPSHRPSVADNISRTSYETDINVFGQTEHLESPGRQDRGFRTLPLPIRMAVIAWQSMVHFLHSFISYIIGKPAMCFAGHIMIWPAMALSGTLESEARTSDRTLSPPFYSHYGRNIVSILYTSYLGTIPSPRINDFQTVFGFMFGGIHCAAWTYSFPTRVEQITWRIAACIITTPSGILLAISVISRITSITLPQKAFGRKKQATGEKVEGLQQTAGEKDGGPQQVTGERKEGLQHAAGRKEEGPMISDQSKVLRRTWISKLIDGLIFPIFCVARVSILVLAILSLRKLPPKALQTVDWLNLIPHI